MPNAGEILLEFILPVLVVAGGLAVAWWPTKKRVSSTHPNGRWVGAIVVSVAYALAAAGVSGPPRWPPGTGDAAYWLTWFTLPLAVLGLLDALIAPPLWLRAPLFLVLFYLAGKVIIAPLPPAPGTQLWLCSLSAAALVFWLSLEISADRHPGLLVPILLAIEFAAAVAVLAVSNDIKPSQTAAALCATAVAALLVALKLRHISLARGAILAWTIPLLGAFILIHFYYYTEPPPAAVALVLLAPLLVFAADLPPARKLGPRWRATLRIILVVLALATAVGLSARQALQAAAQQSGPEND